MKPSIPPPLAAAITAHFKIPFVEGIPWEKLKKQLDEVVVLAPLNSLWVKHRWSVARKSGIGIKEIRTVRAPLGSKAARVQLGVIHLCRGWGGDIKFGELEYEDTPEILADRKAAGQKKAREREARRIQDEIDAVAHREAAARQRAEDWESELKRCREIRERINKARQDAKNVEEARRVLLQATGGGSGMFQAATPQH